ncbi:STAS domain-containing protein [Streptomyces sp. GC420]|uniref:STAS domain-containing protein n=1 Tax=Streptomyces sp. GC420 TaxID=2697568 RepID=UPI001414D698|nr:STAS domain-containing protein [Streptomyces sp. GC420]NBM16330.1 STAS domain-containing protein [Streptomyces sp. GC420]
MIFAGPARPPYVETIELVIEAGTLTRRSAPELCARLDALAEASPAEVVVCDVGAVTRPDLGAVEALARLHVTARRRGRRIRLRNPSAALLELLDLSGLLQVLPLGIEAVGEPEHREEALGVQEAVETGDPPV